MKRWFVCVLIVLASNAAHAALVADSAENLKAIDELLEKRKLGDAIQLAIKAFGLPEGNCRGFKVRSLRSSDEESFTEVVARTLSDQLVVLDPAREAFRGARFLVSILAHEISHCQQYQRLYEVAVSTDKRLAPLKNKVLYLKNLLDMQTHANRLSRDKLKSDAALLGVQLTIEQIKEVARYALEDIDILQKRMGELLELEAALNGVKIKGVFPLPEPGKKASPEFVFHYRYLMLSGTRFLRERAILGVEKQNRCHFSDSIPSQLAAQYGQVCQESLALLQQYIDAVPN